jgi:hypothetical protein
MTNFFEMLVKVFKQYLGSKSGAGVEIWGQNNTGCPINTGLKTDPGLMVHGHIMYSTIFQC